MEGGARAARRSAVSLHDHGQLEHAVIALGHGMGGTWDMRHMTSSLCRIRDRWTLNQRARFSSFCKYARIVNIFV